MDCLPAEVALAVLDGEDGPVEGSEVADCTGLAKSASPAQPDDMPWKVESSCPPPPVLPPALPYYLEAPLPPFMTAPQPGMPATVMPPLPPFLSTPPMAPLVAPMALPPPPSPPCLPEDARCWCRPVLSPCKSSLDADSPPFQPLQSLLAQPDTASPPRAGNPGSALHAEGTCHPCAWFWKAPGCRNGDSCDHCHLCPEGEVKARKKARQTVRRMAATDSPVQTPESKRRQAESPGSSEQSTTCSTSDREEPVSSRSSSSEDEERALLPLLDAGLPRPPPGLEPPSKGSLLHGIGECQPCAWFWKAVGCHNGKNCDFCHACPQGAAKARKKRAKALAEEAAAAAALQAEADAAKAAEAQA